MLSSLGPGAPFRIGNSSAATYDVVLAFDYENLNTPISQTARALKAALEEVGLGAGHGKRLDVVAHRWAGWCRAGIEREKDGHRIVSRLVMLGTPNGGSPWPTVHSLATMGLTAAVNVVTVVPARIYRAFTGARRPRRHDGADESGLAPHRRPLRPGQPRGALRPGGGQHVAARRPEAQGLARSGSG